MIWLTSAPDKFFMFFYTEGLPEKAALLFYVLTGAKKYQENQALIHRNVLHLS